MQTIKINFHDADRAWAEWIGWVLTRSGYSVQALAIESALVPEGASSLAPADATLILLSPDSLPLVGASSELLAELSRAQRLCMVRVRSCEPGAIFASASVLEMVGLDEWAARALLRAEFPALGGEATIASARVDWDESADAKRQPFPPELPMVWNVPFRITADAVDRRPLLDELRHLLTTSHRVGSPAAAALVGPDGVGKTALAAAYATHYATHYRVVWWIRAGDPVTLALDMGALAAALQLEQRDVTGEQTPTQSAITWLDRNDSWLLIFDGVGDRSAMAEFLPSSHVLPKDPSRSDLWSEKKGRGHILFTSCLRDWGQAALMLPVTAWSRVSAVEYVLHRAPGSPRDAAAAAAAMLHDLPLALALAAGAARDASIEPVLDQLAERRRSRSSVGVLQNAFHVVSGMLHDRGGAADLLCLCSFLGDDLVVDPETLTEVAQSVPSLQSLSELTSARQALEGLGISPRGALGLAIHPAILRLLRDQLDLATRRHWAQRALTAMRQAVDAQCKSNAAYAARVLPHAFAAARWAILLGQELEEAAQMLSNSAEYLVQIGHGSAAWRLLAEVAKIAEQTPGVSQRTYASVYYRWGVLAAQYHDDQRAEPWLQHALSLWQGEDAVADWRADSLLCLAQVRWRKRELTAAKAHLEQARAALESSAHPPIRLRAAIPQTLGEVAFETGDYAAADEQMGKTVACWESESGAPVDELVSVLRRRATVQRARGLLTTAQHSLERAMTLVEQRLPPDHPSIGIVGEALGELLSDRGERTQANDRMQKALQLLWKNRHAFRNYDESTPHPPKLRLEAGRALARALIWSGRADLAETEIAGITIFWNKRYLPATWLLLERARALHRINASVAAQKALTELLELATPDSGEAFELYIDALLLEIKLRLACEDYLGAAQSCTRAEELITKARGSSHPTLIPILLQAGELCRRQGDFPQATEVFTRAMKLGVETLGGDHPLVATAAVQLAKEMLRDGLGSEASELCREALRVDRVVFVSPHPAIARDMDALGENLAARGEIQAGRAMFVEALAIREQIQREEAAHVPMDLAPQQEGRQRFLFDQVHVEGFRALGNVALALRSLNVIIGPNGSGKTSLLDLFALLASAMRGELESAVSARGGMRRLLTLDQAERLRVTLRSAPMHLSSYHPTESLEYTLALSPLGTSYAVSAEETLRRRLGVRLPVWTMRREQNRFLTWQGFYGNQLSEMESWGRDKQQPSAQECALPRISGSDHWSNGYSLERALYESLRSTVHMTPAPVADDSPLRRPQILRPSKVFPSASGDDLLSVLYNLRAEHLPWYEQIEDALRAGFPTLNKLDFPIVGAGQVSMAWHDRAHSSPVFANEISAGTLRFLHLCTLLLSPEPPQVILLDEPEVSLHPHLLRLLADLLIQAADRSQIFVATHAAGLLRWLKPEHVVVTDRSEEGVRMRRGDDMSLSGWLDQYSLDQLWEMGEIGGRP